MKSGSSILILALLLPGLAVSQLAFAKENVPAPGLTAIKKAEINRMNRGAEAMAAEEGFDSPTRIIKGFTPIFPASRLMTGTEGRCHVVFTVNSAGRAENMERDPEADEKMCDHAIYALRHWEFAPAMKDGKPVRTRFRMPFSYEIIKRPNRKED